MNLLREYIREMLLAEYVVPMGYSLDRWLKKKDRENLSNKEYAEETKGDKWKVVHGKTRPKRKGKRKRRLRATKRGTPITKASTKLGYKRATNLHTAIKMAESPDKALREMMRRQRVIDLLLEQLTAGQILNVALDVAADSPGTEFGFIRDQSEKLSKRANAMAVYHQGYSGRGDLDAEYLLGSLLGRAVKNPDASSFEALEAGDHAKNIHYKYKPKDWEAYQDIDIPHLLRLQKQERQEEETADFEYDLSLQGSTSLPEPVIDDTTALSEILLLKEASRLTANLFGPLDGAIQKSKFWTFTNEYFSDGVDVTDVNSIRGSYISQTDAAEVLGNSLQSFFDSIKFPITILVNSINPAIEEEEGEGDEDVPDTGEIEMDEDLIVGKGHTVYPDGIVATGNAITDKGRFFLRLSMLPVDETYDHNDVNPIGISSKVGRLIRHELVHMQQLEKRRMSQQTSRAVAAERYKEEGETPDPGDRPKYLSAKVEIDAYAHEIAEEILSKFGRDGALQFLRSTHAPSDVAGMSSQAREYFIDFSRKKFPRRLKSKIYSHVVDMSKQGIY